MIGKRFFFSMSRFEEFSKSRDAQKKNVDRSKVNRKMFVAAKLFLINELKS
jgi:hypothetical protein